MTYPDPKPDEVTRPEFGENIAKPVMPAVTSAPLDPYRARRQVKIIVNHEDLLCGNLEIVGDARYRRAALVHKGRRADYSHACALNPGVRKLCREPAL
jgi:hypothetical protein